MSEDCSHEFYTFKGYSSRPAPPPPPVPSQHEIVYAEIELPRDEGVALETYPPPPPPLTEEIVYAELEFKKNVGVASTLPPLPPLPEPYSNGLDHSPVTLEPQANLLNEGKSSKTDAGEKLDSGSSTKKKKKKKKKHEKKKRGLFLSDLDDDIMSEADTFELKDLSVLKKKDKKISKSDTGVNLHVSNGLG